MIRHRAESPSSAVADAELQADVMRFVAILALCLVAVSSLVDGYRVSAPPVEDSVATPLPVSAESEPMPVSVPSDPSPAGPAPRQEPDPAPIRKTVGISRPAAEPDAPVPEADPRTDQAGDAEAPGLTLRFLTDAALLRLVARGDAGVYVQTGSRTLALDLSDGIAFRESPPPARFYAMAAETVPGVLQAHYAGPEGGKWGVTLPADTSRSIEAFLADNATGELVIDARGRVSLERGHE